MFNAKKSSTTKWDILSVTFITVPFQICSITDKIIPLQSGNVFYERAKLTGALYKHSYIYNGWLYNTFIDSFFYNEYLSYLRRAL